MTRRVLYSYRDTEEPFARIWRAASAEDEAVAAWGRGDENPMLHLLNERIAWGVARGLGYAPLELVS